MRPLRVGDAVNSRAQCEWPEQEAPEHRDARLVSAPTFEVFRAWYEVEHLMLYAGRRRQNLSDEQIIAPIKSTSFAAWSRPCATTPTSPSAACRAA
jgi:hypothetical protein